MKEQHEREFLRFITRMPMYITVSDEWNVVSFVNGYELGALNNGFTEGFKPWLSKKYRVNAGSTGWHGQISLISEKLGWSWLRTFRNSALEFIVTTTIHDLSSDLESLLKTRMQILIERINSSETNAMDLVWKEEWLAFYSTADWFNKLWTSDELQVIRSVNQQIHV
jgi:hypothetical protein